MEEVEEPFITSIKSVDEQIEELREFLGTFKYGAAPEEIQGSQIERRPALSKPNFTYEGEWYDA